MLKNNFVDQYLKQEGLTVLKKDEEKPWGGYYVYEDEKDHDKKVLWVKPGNYLSLQYHGSKEHPGHKEKWVAISDIGVVLGNINAALATKEEIDTDLQNLKVTRLKAGETIEIPSGFIHALVNPFVEDIYVLEIRYSQVEEDTNQREDNIVRIYDQTLRAGTLPWPEELDYKIKSV